MEHRGIRYSLALAAMLVAPTAIAQPPFCADMQRQYLVAVSKGGRGDANQIRHEAAQLQAAARQNGCNRFLIFGPKPSPQCPGILSRLGQLRQQLAATIGSLGPILGGRQDPAVLRGWMVQNGCSVPEPRVAVARSICVRTCDGYYFPIGNGGTRAKVDAEACQSMYAVDGQAELFLQRREGDVAAAVSLDGKRRYGDQPYAFLFQKEFVPSCQAELRTGLVALAKRYLGAKASLPESRPDHGPDARVVGTPLPRLRPVSAGEDPETNAGAKELFDEYRQLSTPSTEAPHVRFVGDSYYAELFAAKGPEVRPHRPPLGYDLLEVARWLSAPTSGAAADEVPTN